MNPGQTGKPAGLDSIHPFPRWRVPGQSQGQISGFSWFLSSPPWFNLLAFGFHFVQSFWKFSILIPPTNR